MNDGFEVFSREDEKTAEGRKKRRRKGYYKDGAEMTPEEYHIKTVRIAEFIKITLMLVMVAATCVTMLFTMKNYNISLQNYNDRANRDNDEISYAEVAAETTASHSEAVSETEQQQNIGLININTADKSTLMQLSGIGEVKAQAIIDYRNENGKFYTVDELLKVNGIGEKTLEKFKDEITVG